MGGTDRYRLLQSLAKLFQKRRDSRLEASRAKVTFGCKAFFAARSEIFFDTREEVRPD